MTATGPATNDDYIPSDDALGVELLSIDCERRICGSDTRREEVSRKANKGSYGTHGENEVSVS